MRARTTHSSKIQPVTVALIAFAYFVIVVVALYFLNPAYSLLNSFAGNYDLSPYEFLTATTFFSLGLGSLALAVGLYQHLLHSVRSLVGLIFLSACGVGMLTAGVFPANEGGSTVPHVTTTLIAGMFPVQVIAVPETTFSFIHILAIIGSLVSLSLAALLLSWRFRQHEKWHPIYKPALILAVVMIAVSILFCSVLLHPALAGYSGLINPIILVVIGIVVGLFWLSLIAGRLHLMGVHTQ
jgi:hypothetical protein